MSTRALDSCSDITCSTSETSVADGTSDDFKDEKENCDQEQTEFSKLSKTSENFLKIEAITHNLAEQINVANEKAARLCSQRKKVKQRDAMLTEESTRRIATSQFFEDNKNRYLLRREEHELQLGKLREEQLKIQENIFGKAKTEVGFGLFISNKTVS